MGAHRLVAPGQILLRATTSDFPDLVAYRRFIDELVGLRNARNAKRIESERETLRSLPDRRTCAIAAVWT